MRSLFGYLGHLLALAALPLQSVAMDAPSNDGFAVHGQVTFVNQWTSGFNSPYAGPNSMTPNQSKETADLTVYLGARAWRGAEFWVNPEIDQGFGLNNTLGAAGFPSGEAYKVGKSHPYLKWQRLFLRQNIDLDGEREPVAGNANQFAGTRSMNRIVITAGKFGVGDVFDTNQFAHDPRADFLNWTAIDAGSFDYAADAWGYTAGVAIEWYQSDWTVRTGIFDLSDVPNSEHLEPGFHEFQMLLETERRHTLAGRAGKLSLTIFDSRGRMGLLDQAVNAATQTGSAVDVAAVRRYRSRTGLHLNLEQTLTQSLGLFARFGKSAGNVEAYEFTDIDRSWAVGLSIKGDRWHRAGDCVGIAGMVNAISAARQRFLAAGGLGILIGDGRLDRPGTEQILETYYNAAILGPLQITADYQWLRHPAYNLDRGPISVIGLRVHAQF